MGVTERGASGSPAKDTWGGGGDSQDLFRNTVEAAESR
jgi:hypothetical protein